MAFCSCLEGKSFAFHFHAKHISNSPDKYTPKNGNLDRKQQKSISGQTFFLDTLWSCMVLSAPHCKGMRVEYRDNGGERITARLSSFLFFRGGRKERGWWLAWGAREKRRVCYPPSLEMQLGLTFIFSKAGILKAELSIFFNLR